MGKQYDVIIIGAGLSGSVCAAILAQRGLKTLVIEKDENTGGRATPLDIGGGNWIDIGAKEVLFVYGKKAANLVGEKVHLVGPHEPWCKAHYPDEGNKIVDVSFLPEDMHRTMTEFMQIPEQDVDSFLSYLESFKTINDARINELKEQSVDQWAVENSIEDPIRMAFYRLGDAFGIPNDRIHDMSIGEIARIFKETDFEDGMFYANDPDLPGAAGLLAPFFRAMKKHNAEIVTGQKVTEVTIKDSRVTAVITVDKNGLYEKYTTSSVISSVPIWDIFNFVDESLFPPKFVQNAQDLWQWAHPLITYWIGLKEIPKRRHDGKREDYFSWQRVLFGSGEDKSYGGGWHFTSEQCPSMAPSGTHLLNVGKSMEKKSIPYDEAKAYIQQTLDYLKEFYIDLDQLIQWSKLQMWPTSFGIWNYSTTPRPHFKSEDIKGLYFTGDTTDVGECPSIDSAAHAGMECSKILLEDLGMTSFSIEDL